MRDVSEYCAKAVIGISTFPKNILVADPDNTRCVRLSVLLKRLEYNVFVATNGFDLLRIANAIIPNLILLDVNMPFIEGQTCLQRLRSERSLSLIKVVMTAERKDEKQFLDGASQKAASGVIFRPLRPTELYALIQRLTETRPRKTPRLRVIFKVSVLTERASRVSYASMISEDGAFIHTMNPLPAGTPVKLALELPSAKPITLSGSVIYNVKGVKADFLEPGMGIIFKDVPQTVKEGLRGFIEEHLYGDIDYEAFG